MDEEIDRFPRRFVFHGNAVAAEVFLTRIGETEQYIVQPVAGQSSLPVIGGHSESMVQTPTMQPDLAKVFAYSAPSTMADGRFDQDGVAITTVQASVSAVQVINSPSRDESSDGRPIVFSADALSLSMRSMHPPRGQARIEFAGRPQFQNVVFNGLPVVPELNDELMKLAGWDELEENFRTNRAFFDNSRASFAPLDQEGELAFGQKIPFAHGSYALCSIVRSIKWGDRTIPGHVLVQPGFGTIYFGEMLLNDRERRVTMVRMQLGSGNGGQAVFAENAPNGTWVPPRR